MPTVLDRLLYAIEIDGRKANRDVAQVEHSILGLGSAAEKTFKQTVGRSLASALDPTTSQKKLDQISKDLKAFGKDAEDTFQKTFGRKKARELFDPYVKEANTFTGKLKTAFREAFDVKKLALGAAAGLGVAQLARSLGRAGTAAIEFAADFDFALAKVRTIAGEKFNLNVVTSDLERIATTVPQDLNTLTNALYFTITSGIRDIGQATQFLEVGAKSAVAGITDATVSIDALTTIVNAYNKDASKATHISDILFKTVDQGKVTYDGLAKSIGDVASPAALLNVQLESVGAATATMTKAGINIEETTTAIRNLFLQIANAGPEAIKVARGLGIDLSEAGIKAAGGFAPFIKSIADATNGNIKLLAQVAGNRRAFRALAILAGTNADEFQRLDKEFNNLEFTAGATERAFAILNKTARNQYKLFKDSLLVAFKSFGDYIIEQSLPAFAELTKFFSNLDPIDAYIKRLTELGASVEQLEVANQAKAYLTAQKTIKETAETLKELETSNNKLADFLRGQDIDVGWLAVFNNTFSEAKDFTKELIKQTETVQGLTEAQELQADIIKRSQERLSLMTILRTKDSDVAREGIDRLEQEQEIDSARLAIIAKIVEQRTFELEAKKQLGGLSKEELQALEEQKKKLEEIEKVAGTISEETETTKEEQELAADEAERMRKQLELVQANTDFEKGLIQIRQETEKTIEKYKEFPETIATATRLAGAKIRQLLEKTIEPLSDTTDAKAKIAEIDLLGLEIRKAFSSFPSIVFKSIRDGSDLVVRSYEEVLRKTDELETKIQDSFTKIPITLQAAQIEFAPTSTPSFDIDASGKVRLNVDAIFKPIGDAIEEFRGQMEIAGFALDDNFVQFVSTINWGAGEVASQIVRLADAFQAFSAGTGNVFSLLGAGVGLIKSIVGIDTGSQRKEAERRAEAEQKSEAATRKLIQSLQELNATLSDGKKTATELNVAFQKYSGTAQALLDLGGGAEFATGELQQIAGAIQEFVAQTGEIPGPEGLGGLIEYMLGFGGTEQERQLAQKFQRVFDELPTDDLKNRLIEALVGLGAADEALKNFGKSTYNFTNLMANLQFEFDVFDISDPVDQLKRFQEFMLSAFGVTLPQGQEALKDFLQAGFEALTAGGQELLDFLSLPGNLGLRSLTPDELQAFFQELAGFLDGVSELTGSGFSGILDNLQLQFDLFNIDDPLKQLTLFREAMGTLGAKLPESAEGLRAFAQDAFAALTGPAEDLQAFLEQYGLESLGRDEFKDFLLTLDGFLDDIGGAAGEGFEAVLTRLRRKFDLFEINDPLEQLAALRLELNKIGAINVPDSVSGLEQFVRDAFTALTDPSVDLGAFLAKFNLQDLAESELESLIETIDGFIDNIGETTTSGFSGILSDLSLRFDIFDITDPVKQLAEFRKAITALGARNLPSSIEGLEQFARAAFNALALPADDFANFLSQYGLQDLGKSEFKSFLQRLEGFIDQINRQADDIETVGPVGLAKTFTQEITLGQANEMLSELSTIRIVLTQIFEFAKAKLSGGLDSASTTTGLRQIDLAQQSLGAAKDLTGAVSELLPAGDQQTAIARQALVTLGGIENVLSDSKSAGQQIVTLTRTILEALATGIQVLDPNSDAQLTALNNINTALENFTISDPESAEQINILGAVSTALEKLIALQESDFGSTALLSFLQSGQLEALTPPQAIPGLDSVQQAITGGLDSLIANFTAYQLQQSDGLAASLSQRAASIDSLARLGSYSLQHLEHARNAEWQRTEMINRLTVANELLEGILLTTNNRQTVEFERSAGTSARDIQILSKGLGG